MRFDPIAYSSLRVSLGCRCSFLYQKVRAGLKCAQGTTIWVR